MAEENTSAIFYLLSDERKGNGKLETLSGKLMRSVVVFVLCVLSMFTLRDEASAQSAVKPDINYRPALGATSPKLDIYSFPNAKNAPVMIYVHGGGWTRGNKNQVSSKPSYFANLGYVFVSLDYRLVPKVKLEEQLEDIDHALGWINENISIYGGNSNNLHLMGHSAGAHLVAMTGVAPGKFGRQLIDSGALRSIISNDTMAYDMPRIAEVSGGSLPTIYRRVFGNKKKRWESLSPQFYVNGLNKTPAWLVMFSGKKFGRFRTKSSLNFAYLLRQANTRVSVFDGSRFSHRHITILIGVDEELNRAVDDFLKRNSK